ncbi:hypothetical protein FRX31_027540 [Thalictrum thalictroides]|uniref:Uncharacterized protein n=1 Tax=Thalictrum thalictroides TaxID=46969 RepID=A0A7J6VCN4_THATH|nr:hypothetical protein FRX31_027540 [Thalictrum thalictroides]
MCLSAKISFYEVNETVAPLELSLFILDECGDISHNQFPVCAKSRNGAMLYTKPVLLDHDHCEDG